jgi:hypothetical protein
MSENESTIKLIALPSEGEVRGAPRRAEELVERTLDVSELRNRFAQFMRAMEGMLAVEETSTGAFQLSQVQFSAEISADGEFKLMGIGVGVATSSAITFVLERQPSHSG